MQVVDVVGGMEGFGLVLGRGGATNDNCFEFNFGNFRGIGRG